VLCNELTCKCPQSSCQTIAVKTLDLKQHWLPFSSVVCNVGGKSLLLQFYCLLQNLLLTWNCQRISARETAPDFHLKEKTSIGLRGEKSS